MSIYPTRDEVLALRAQGIGTNKASKQLMREKVVALLRDGSIPVNERLEAVANYIEEHC